MHSVRYRVLLRIAERPRAFTHGLGVLTALSCFLALVLGAIWADQARIVKQHDDAMRAFHAMSIESQELLKHLATHDDLSCTPSSLLHLNAHLLRSRHIREIGILNADNQLTCSTALGIIGEPLKGEYRVYRTQNQLELLVNVPLAVSDEGLSALIVQDPPYNVVLSPYGMDLIYSSADVTWLRTSEGLVIINTKQDAGLLPEQLKRAENASGTRLIPSLLGYEHVSKQPGVDLVLQSKRTVGMLSEEHPLMFPSLLLVSLLVGSLVTGTIKPHIQRLTALRERIAYLCAEPHLALVYQPIFDLISMRPVGCEVLARVTEGERTWMPDALIPALQDAQLEQEFDHVVTRKAVRELALHLPRQTDRFSVALNFFPKSIKPDTLIPLLENALLASGRQDLDICIEIIEHAISNELVSEVHSLKERGFQIAVDDFGTGYSNLRSVTQLSPDHLKIDRSFVCELEDATLRSNLIPEIVDIARAVNAQTIAEGIENMQQARLLRLAGVREGPGYALARPMPIAQLKELMQRFA